MIRNRVAVVAVASVMLIGSASQVVAGDWPQWRGPNRDGVSTETGLLKSWTEGPPALLWQAAGLGDGYASVVVSNGLLFTIGRHGREVLCTAIDIKTGDTRWARTIGTTGRIPTSTPTVDRNRVYAMDPDGELLCLAADSGEILWERDLNKDFGARLQSGRGHGESVLIDGDKLICTPGGARAMLAALNKTTGKDIWQAAIPDIGNLGRDGASFSSIVISEAAGVRQYVQLAGRGLIGIEAESGRFLWGYNGICNATVNIPTPVVHGDYVFSANGYNSGSVLLKLSKDGDDGVTAEEVYRLRGNRFQNHHGGFVRIGKSIFGGHGSNNGLPTCLDLMTGKIRWKRRGPGVGSAAVVSVDGHLIFRYQNGVVALIEVSEEAYRLKGTLQIPGAGGDSWSHPVVSHGRLFLREKDSLYVFDLKNRAGDVPSVTARTELRNPATASLRKLGVPVRPLAVKLTAGASLRERFEKYAGSDGTETLQVSLIDDHLAEEGRIKPDIHSALAKLDVPFLLNLEGSGISNKGIEELKTLKAMTGLRLELCPNVNDGTLAIVGRLSQLRLLSLAGTSVTNEGLTLLEPLKKLRALDLEVCDGITDPGCRTVSGFKQLRALVLKKTAFEKEFVTDAGIAALSGLNQLELLSVYGNRVSNAGAESLSSLSNLNTLDISLTTVNDDGLAHLSNLRTLRHLSMLYSEGFGGPMLSDKGIVTLTTLDQLRSIDLTGAKVTDKSLDVLAGRRRLRRLKLVNTQVTDEGVQAFQRRLPECVVIR